MSASQAGRKGKKTLVVGAGVAGLCAAFELRELGYNVEVLEASEQSGGRIRTVRDPFADGLYADVGAAMFTDADTRVLSYLEQFALPKKTVPMAGNPDQYFLRRHWVAGKKGVPLLVGDLRDDEKQLSLPELFLKYIVKDLIDTPLHPLDPLWPPAHLHRFDQVDGQRFLEDRGASPAAIRILQLGLLGLNGEGIESYSALSLLALASLAILASDVVFIVGGNDQLPDAFARRLGSRIHYGAKVEAIHTRNGVVHVHLRPKLRKTVVLEADHVIVALPFSVLRHVRFSPRLSPEKQEIVRTIGTTSVTRTFMQMDTRFWEDRVPEGLVLSDQPPAALMSGCPIKTITRGILETYSGSDEARDLSHMSVAHRLEFALGRVAQIFPDAIEHFEGGTSICWDREEHARGAYAWFRPRRLMKFLPHLARPEGKVHFAGDETTPMPGWTEAAVHSGQRAAKEVHQACMRGTT